MKAIYRHKTSGDMLLFGIEKGAEQIEASCEIRSDDSDSSNGSDKSDKDRDGR